MFADFKWTVLINTDDLYCKSSIVVCSETNVFFKCYLAQIRNQFERDKNKVFCLTIYCESWKNDASNPGIITLGLLQII